jgi:hexokinase
MGLCFLIPAAFGLWLYAAAIPRPEPVPPSAAESRLFPDRFGQVTAGEYFGSDVVIVAVQDLHCHPEVQRNIAGILSAVDTRWGLARIYVEGGYGAIDTSWIPETLPQDAAQHKILETLVDRGIVTGSEYYSIVSGKYNVLQGIEDEKLHGANIARLAEILNHKDVMNRRLAALQRELKRLQFRYMDPSACRFERLFAAYHAGLIEPVAYYRRVERYLGAIHKDRRALSAEKYPNITAYRELAHAGRQLSYRRIARQGTAYTAWLRPRLPYRSYAVLNEGTPAGADPDQFYGRLAAVGKGHPSLAAVQFPDLLRFFAYRENKRRINVARLLEEERLLAAEVRRGLASSSAAVEVSFLSDFVQAAQDYASGKISAAAYEYVTRRFDTFRQVWGMYAAPVGQVEAFFSDGAVLNEYYAVNCARTDAFISRMPPLNNAPELPAAPEERETGSTIETRIMESLKTARAEAVITGGFHTPGLVAHCRKRRISYLVVTPHASQNTTPANEAYERLIRIQAATAKDALNAKLFSGLSSREKIGLLLTAVSPAELRSAGMPVDRIGEGAYPLPGAEPSKALSALRDAVRGAVAALVAQADSAFALARGDSDALLTKLLAAAVQYQWYEAPGLPRGLSQALDAVTDEELNGIQKEIIAQFPEFLAEAAYERYWKTINYLDQKAQRSTKLKVLLSIPLLNDLLVRSRAPAPADTPPQAPDWTAKQIKNLFKLSQQYARILSGKSPRPQDAKMIPSIFIPSTGQESGEYIAVDWGGSNLRVARIMLAPGKEPEIRQLITRKFTKKHKSGSDDPFALLAQSIGELNLVPGAQYRLGMTFSHPLTNGALYNWGKGWHIPAAVGQNIGSMVQAALEDRGITTITVQAVQNDVIAAQLSVKNAQGAVILGTGFNISTVCKGVIVNCELTADRLLARMKFLVPVDRLLLRTTDPRGVQAMEKMVSGEYLGMHLRLRLQKLHKEKRFMHAGQRNSLLDDPALLRRAEFKDDSELFTLAEAIAQAAGRAIRFDTAEQALDWINNTAVLFSLFNTQPAAYLSPSEQKLYRRLVKRYMIAGFPDLRAEQAAELITTPEGRQMQRIILGILFGDLMPADTPDVVMTKLVSIAERYETVEGFRAALQEEKQLASLCDLSDADLNTMRAVSHELSVRAGGLVAAAVYAHVRATDPAVATDHTVVVTGSVYDKHPRMRAYINEGILALRRVNKKDSRAGAITLVYIQDASLVGAAVAAAQAAAAQETPNRNEPSPSVIEETPRTPAVTVVLHAVRSAVLAENQSRFPAADGLVHLWVSEGTDENMAAAQRYGLMVPVPGSSVLADVWIAPRNGAPDFFVDLKKAGVQPEEYDQALRTAAAQIVRSYAGTDARAGDPYHRRQVQALMRPANNNTSGNLAPLQVNMVVDHGNDVARTKKAFADAGINRPLVVGAEELNTMNSGQIRTYLQRKRTRRDARYRAAANKFIDVDAEDIADFTSKLHAVRTAANVQIIVKGELFNETNTNEIETAVKNQIYVIARDNAHAKLLREYGFERIRYAEEISRTDLSGLVEKNIAAEKILDIIIPDTMTPEEIHAAFTKLDVLPAMIFHYDDMRKLKNSGDILDARFFDALLSALFNVGNTEIRTEEDAWRVGVAWDLRDLPQLSDGDISALAAGAFPLAAQNSAAFEEAAALSDKSTLRNTFARAIAGNMLLEKRLRDEDAAIADAYRQGSFRCDPLYTYLVCEALLVQAPATNLTEAPVTFNPKDRLSAIVERYHGKPLSYREAAAIIDLIFPILVSEYNLQKNTPNRENAPDPQNYDKVLAAA